MDKDRIKGKMEEIKGDVKQRIGGASKDPAKQAEGFIEEQKGKLQGGVGKVKDEVRAEQEKRREPESED